MRIINLHIDGFGHFADTDYGPIEAPITVFYGPNEAGKSTLLAFLRTMFFGFPPTKRDAFYPPLRGGAHGGRIFLEDDGGGGYHVALSESNKGVVARLSRVASADQLDPQALDRLLGHASKGMFESVFAFNLADLEKLGPLGKGDASRQIYSAGMGAAKVPSALTGLQKRQDELFKPGGSNQEVARLLNELDAVERELRESANGATRFADLTEHLAKTEAEIRDLTATAKDVDLLVRRTERLRAAFDDWVEGQALEGELAGLPERASFPVDGLNRLAALEERARQASEQLADRTEDASKAQTALEAGAIDRAVLENAGEIDRLRRGRQGFDASVADAPKRASELRQLREELEEALRGLGQDWDLARLDTFDESIPVQAEINAWDVRLRDAERLYHAAEGEAGQAEKDAQRAAGARAAEEDRLGALEPSRLTEVELDDHRRRLLRCRGLLDERRIAGMKRESLEAQADDAERTIGSAPAVYPNAPRSMLPFVLGGGGLIAILAGLLLGGTAIVLGVLLGVMLLGAGVALYFGNPQPRATQQPAAEARPAAKLAQQLAAAVSAEAELTERLSAEAAVFRLTRLDREAFDDREARLNTEASLLREVQHQEQRLQDAAKNEGTLATHAVEAQATLERLGTELDALRREWQSWLTARGLDPGLMPATVGAVFVQVTSGRKSARAVADAEHRLERIEADIDEFVAAVQALCARLGIPVDTADRRRVARVVDELADRMDEAKRADAAGKQAQLALDEATTRLQRATRADADARDEVAALLGAGGCSEAEEFRRAAQDDGRRAVVVERLRDCNERLQRHCAHGTTIEGLKAELAAADPVALEQELADLAERAATVKDELGRLQQAFGQVSNELSTLRNQEKTSSLRADRERLKASLSEAAHQWSIATLARGLLLEAQATYEKERQPGVIKQADAVFSAITGGRYHGLMSPFGGGQRLTVVDRDGTTKDAEQLSTGTQQALYLALRFGLIREFGTNSVHLPVIVDEVLVNFDAHRARRAAEGFAELSKTNQVLVFTCHESMRDLFLQVAPMTQVIEIGGER